VPKIIKIEKLFAQVTAKNVGGVIQCFWDAVYGLCLLSFVSQSSFYHGPWSPALAAARAWHH